MALTFYQKHRKSISAFLTLAIAAGVGYVVYSQKISVPIQLKDLENATSDFLVQKLHTTILTPPPLKDTAVTNHGSLSRAGVLESTNESRAEQNLPPLTSNPVLNLIAQKKLQDMFFYQYFEHVSPLNMGPGDLAKDNNYDYILIGENLAMGNFTDDAALVDAWMQSPGHRANILNNRYKEIGIAVGESIYEGKSTWIAVQEFGLPTNVCPQPLTQDKLAIDAGKKDITAKESVLATKKEEIDAFEKKSGADYDAKVDAYNNLVREYNTSVLALKAKIASYNKAVGAFNTCAQSI